MKITMYNPDGTSSTWEGTTGAFQHIFLPPFLAAAGPLGMHDGVWTSDPLSEMYLAEASDEEHAELHRAGIYPHGTRPVMTSPTSTDADKERAKVEGLVEAVLNEEKAQDQGQE